MAGSGFTNDIMHADNVDFTGNFPITPTVTIDGQLLIGSTASPKIRVGSITSPLGTVTIGYLSPNITIDIAGGGKAVEHLTGNTGGMLNPDGSNNFNTLGTGSITIAGSGSTLTTQLTGLTNHAVLVGAGTATITKVGPTSTAGQVLQSAGAAADPAFSTATYPITTTVSQILYSSSTNTVTGLATANRAVLTTGATGIPVLTALATDGQVIIGSTAGSPAAATLTQGTGITITNASNSITIAVSGSVVGQTITGDTGGALSPTSGNWNIIGQDGIKTSGSGSTLTVTPRGTGTFNMFLGQGAGNGTLSGSRNVSYGGSSAASITSGSNNTFLGYNSGNPATTADNNVGVGDTSLVTLTQGAANTAVGQAALQRLTTGSNNVAIGRLAINNVVTGDNNVAIGQSAATNLGNGSSNIIIGQNAASQYASTESSNIIIGAPGVASESSVIRIGSGQTTTYIVGINGVTVTGTAVLCATDGKLGTVVSSIRYKDNVKTIPDDVTDALMHLTPSQFNYKFDEKKSTHYGLIAEEVEKVFPYLCFYKDEKPESVKYHEIPTLLLSMLQKLTKRVEELEKRLS